MSNDQEDGSVITPRDAAKSFARAAGSAHQFVYKRFHGLVLDVEDVHFHFDSAVMLPDFGDCGQNVDSADENRITGLAVLRAVYRHTAEHPDRKILIAGHTDREGPEKYNLELSRLRAENVLHLLLGNRGDWVKSCNKKNKVEDYQQILKWVYVTWGWTCDPGKVDNDLGDETKKAIRAFQRLYNAGTPHLPEGFHANISVDGEVGEQTWGAFFDVYMVVLKLILETDDAGLQAKRKSLTFVNDAVKTVGCGETHANVPDIIGPSSTAGREQHRALARIDRRVQVLFFYPGEEPLLDCHPSDGSCIKEQCEIYFKHFFRFELLTCDPIAAPAVRVWPLRLLIRGPRTAGQTEPAHVALTGRRYAVVPVGADGGPVPEGVSPVLRGTTDDKGLLRIPVSDEHATMILKVDVGGLLLLSPAPATTPADTPAPASPPEGSAWDGEDTFMQFRLDCGSLKPLSDPGSDPAQQRLHNLGYGSADITNKRAAVFSAKAFQRDYNLNVSGGIDNLTLQKIRELYGS